MGMQPFPGLLELKSKSYLNSSGTEAAASSLHHFNSNSLLTFFRCLFRALPYSFLSLIFGIKLHLHKHHQSHKLGL